MLPSSADGEIPRLRSSGRLSISKPYLLTYPDGSRKHIDRDTRDSLLISLLAKQTGPNRYLYTGPVRTYHSFSELGSFEVATVHVRKFLPGEFVFEFRRKRVKERLETPEHMAMRLTQSPLEAA